MQVAHAAMRRRREGVAGAGDAAAWAACAWVAWDRAKQAAAVAAMVRAEAKAVAA